MSKPCFEGLRPEKLSENYQKQKRVRKLVTLILVFLLNRVVDLEQGIAHDAVNSVKKSSKAADLASSSTVTAPSSQSSTTTSVTCIPAEPSDSRPLQALRNPKPFIKRPNTFETRSKPTQVASVGASSVLQATTRSLPHALQRTTATAMRKWSLRYRSRRLTRLLIGGSVIQLGTGTTTLLYQYRFPMS
ncbi:hypothetical protein F5878DRAFT_368246 [Lentinula raphanica]|uniref:Uncharacterized protein n=1 Tax=Lentinula raphanica TaxID=153919 RepID=A0AA38U9L7_9AGAR|nr:hypothetical protein F5878DRAFT_368246 [Lentinula raphanica]